MPNPREHLSLSVINELARVIADETTGDFQDKWVVARATPGNETADKNVFYDERDAACRAPEAQRESPATTGWEVYGPVSVAACSPSIGDWDNSSGPTLQRIDFFDKPVLDCDGNPVTDELTGAEKVVRMLKVTLMPDDSDQTICQEFPLRRTVFALLGWN